jgi:outer membrane protein OmpA-like peptidoglycan-associated protein
MSRSVNALTAVAVAAGAVFGTGQWAVAEAAQPAGSAPSPTPAATPFLTPSSTPTGPVAAAPILDLRLPIVSLDGSLTDVTNGRRRKIVVAADVLFAFNRATLTSAAKSRIDAVVQVLRQRAGGKQVTVDGYTDAKGSDTYNQGLSQRRAEAVRGALAAAVSESGITFVVRGRGEADPIASNTTKDGRDNPKGRAKNRRVEISFNT